MLFYSLLLLLSCSLLLFCSSFSSVFSSLLLLLLLLSSPLLLSSLLRFSSASPLLLFFMYFLFLCYFLYTIAVWNPPVSEITNPYSRSALAITRAELRNGSEYPFESNQDSISWSVTLIAILRKEFKNAFVNFFLNFIFFGPHSFGNGGFAKIVYRSYLKRK